MADDIARLGYEIDSSQARTAASDLDKLNAASVRVAKGYDNLGSASRNLLRDERGKFLSAQQSAEKYSQEIDMLRAKYNPLYAASKQLAAGQDEVRRALELGAINAKQASSAMDVLEAKYGVTGRAAQAMGNQVRGATAHTTNLMFQFQDIGMMLAAGQNPLMLAMQQGTQVSGVFQQMKNSGQSAFAGIRAGLLAMASPMALMTIGVIAGVAALTQWAASALGASEDAEKLADKVTDIASSATAYKNAIDAAAISTVDLVSKFGMQADEMQRLYDLQVQLQRIELEQKIRDFAASAVEQYSSMANELEKITRLSKSATESTLSQSSAQDLLNKSVERLRNEYGLGVGQAYALSAAIEQIGAARTIDEQADAAQRFGEELVKAADGGATIPPEMVRLAIEAGVAADTIRQLEGALFDAADAARTIQIPGGGGRGDPRQFTSVDEFRGQLADQSAWEAPKSSGGRKRSGGGGKSAAETLADEMQARYEALNDGLQSETALTNSKYAKDLETLQWALDQQKLTRAEYDEAQNVLRIEAWGSEAEQQALQYELEQQALAAALEQRYITEAQYQARIEDLRYKHNIGTLAQTQQFMGDMANALAGGNEKMAKIAQTFASVEALINAYRAYNQVLADPSLPWYAKIPAAVSVLAAGMKTVQSIKGASSGGGTSAAPSSASGTTATAEPERRVVVTLDGPDWVKGIIEPIMTQIYEQTADGTKVVFSR